MVVYINSEKDSKNLFFLVKYNDYDLFINKFLEELNKDIYCWNLVGGKFLNKTINIINEKFNNEQIQNIYDLFYNYDIIDNNDSKLENGKIIYNNEAYKNF